MFLFRSDKNSGCYGKPTNIVHKTYTCNGKVEIDNLICLNGDICFCTLEIGNIFCLIGEIWILLYRNVY